MKKLSILITALLFITNAMAGTLRITQNSSNANTHKLWKEKVIPMFEKENPGIKVKIFSTFDRIRFIEFYILRFLYLI